VLLISTQGLNVIVTIEGIKFFFSVA